MADLRVHLAPESYLAALRADVRAGLTASPKTLPPKYFYDARGSELFDEITRLPEYYPTRAETAILQRRSAEIAELAGARTLVELGSGTSEKTRLLLHALTDRGTLRRFVPFDVDPVVLGEATEVIGDEYPGLSVEPVVGDFEEHLGLLGAGGHRMIAFLGSTIGNLEPAARARFLSAVAATMGEGDTFLLGTDLVKDADRLRRAYDDDAGVTAEFNRNVLAVVNRELTADFDLDAFEHVAFWDAENLWVDIRLRSLARQTVQISSLDMNVPFGRGEEMRTEISTKFAREGLAGIYAEAGLEMVGWWTDPEDLFALSLAQRSG
jgi:L-histidine N-alpha-methyltransferase